MSLVTSIGFCGPLRTEHPTPPGQRLLPPHGRGYLALTLYLALVFQLALARQFGNRRTPPLQFL